MKKVKVEPGGVRTLIYECVDDSLIELIDERIDLPIMMDISAVWQPLWDAFPWKNGRPPFGLL